MISRFDLGFIVGVIEGEGCLHIVADNRKRNIDRHENARIHLRGEIVIECTSKDLIDKCKTILKPIAKNTRSLRHKTNPYRYPKRMDTYRLTVGNQRDLLCVLELIEPYLVSKQKQAKILIDFLKSRLQNPITQWQEARPYSEREIELYEELKSYHTKGKNPKSFREWVEKINANG